jgi:hypothetical protein
VWDGTRLLNSWQPHWRRRWRRSQPYKWLPLSFLTNSNFYSMILLLPLCPWQLASPRSRSKVRCQEYYRQYPYWASTVMGRVPHCAMGLVSSWTSRVHACIKGIGCVLPRASKNRTLNSHPLPPVSRTWCFYLVLDPRFPSWISFPVTDLALGSWQTGIRANHASAPAESGSAHWAGLKIQEEK